MAIRVSCICSKQLKLKDGFAGKRVKCPACGKGIAVPGASNGHGANGNAPSPALGEAGSAFDFDSPAMESVPAGNGAFHNSVPNESAKDDAAKVDGAKIEPATSEPKDPAKKGRAALVAILAAFVLLVAGLAVAVIMLMSGGGTDPDDPEHQDGFASAGNRGDKLTLEEEQAKLIKEAEVNHAAQVAAQRKSDEAAKLAAEEAAREAARKKVVADAEKLLAQKEAEEQRLKKAREDGAKLRIVDARKRAEMAQKLVLDGKNAMAAGQPDKAKRAFDQAAKLDPANKDAKAGLVKATLEDNKVQKKVRFAQLVATGQKSLQDKKYDLAVSSLKLAIELNPDDGAAADALKKAEAEKRKLDAGLDKFLKRGYRALKRHDFAMAGKAFDEADIFAPGHPKVVEAKNTLLVEKNRGQAEAAAKKKQEEDRKVQLKKDKDEFERYLKQGRNALEAKKFADAERDFTLATKLFPEDKIARALLRRAHEQSARASDAEKRKRLAEEMHKRKEARDKALVLIKKGKKSLEEKLYQEAVNALSEAYVLVPGDKTVVALLKKASKGLEDERLASAKKRQTDEEARKADQVRKLFTEAREALKVKDYDRTDTLLAELAKLVPNDPDILGLRQEVRTARKTIEDEKTRLAAVKAAEDAREAEGTRKKLLADFDGKMKKGQSALTGKKFDKAIEAFAGALKLVQKQKGLADEEKAARTALESAKKANRNDKLKLKLDQ